LTRYFFSLRTSPVLKSLQVPPSWQSICSSSHEMMSFTWNRQLLAVTTLWGKSSKPWHYVLYVSSHFLAQSMGFEIVKETKKIINLLICCTLMYINPDIISTESFTFLSIVHSINSIYVTLSKTAFTFRYRFEDWRVLRQKISFLSV